MSNFLTRALIENDTGYVIERSLRFNAASSQYLTRTPPAGNRTAWTVSLWIKRGKLGTRQDLFGVNNSNGLVLDISGGTDKLQFQVYNGAGADYYILTSNALRDPSAWYHIVAVWDSNNATAADRMRLYINGSRASGITGNTIPLGALSTLNSATELNFGRNPQGGFYFDGYLSEIHFVDGQALTPPSFGEINPTTGQWVAKKYTGAYGTNGFYLDFKDGTSTATLGYDTAGSNDWTLTNFTRSAGVNDCWMLDVPAGNGSASAVQPSGNYAVLNPLNTKGGTFSKANLFYTAPSAWRASPSTILLPSTGKIYVEATLKATPGSGFAQIYATIGVIAPSAVASWGFNSASSFYVADTGDYVNYTSGSAGSFAGNAANTVLALLIDRDANQVAVYQNNTSVITVTLGIASGVEMYIFNCNYDGTRGAMDINFGQRSFAYTPPTGFKALCTANLPTPSIKKPSDHFNVQLSTGANIKTDSEALFTNELEWIKDRANANNHQLIDSVRGSTAVLQSNTNATETTYSAPSGSSVGWVWRASDSVAVTNNVGTISSQVSANPTAGFSVVTYTGTGVNATVGHGLGAEPEVVITKRRNSTGNWQMYHKKLNVGTNPQNYRISLNSNGPFALDSTAWNSTAPNSSTFSLGTNVDGNANTGTYVAYCFKEIPGYSKFGTYVPNGSADGPFEHTGFKPGFLMVKYPTAGTGSWVIYDSIRNTGNPAELDLLAESTAAEATLTGVDFLSNGFKLRGTSANINTSGGTQLIYMAFAETPFNYANAR